MDADGSNLQVLTNNITPDLTPNWTPDGSKIIFHRTIGGFNQLHVMNADGTDVQQLTDAPDTLSSRTLAIFGCRSAHAMIGRQGSI